jgi:hypothetical protein
VTEIPPKPAPGDYEGAGEYLVEALHRRTDLDGDAVRKLVDRLGSKRDWSNVAADVAHRLYLGHSFDEIRDSLPRD